MASILSAIMFLRELVFGRIKTAARTKAQLLRSGLIIAAVALSLYGNFVFLKLWYGSTARYIATQRLLADQQELQRENYELKTKVLAYEKIINQFGEYFPLPPVQEAKQGHAPKPKPSPAPQDHQQPITVITIPPPRAEPQPERQTEMQ